MHRPEGLLRQIAPDSAAQATRQAGALGCHSVATGTWPARLRGASAGLRQCTYLERLWCWLRLELLRRLRLRLELLRRLRLRPLLWAPLLRLRPLLAKRVESERASGHSDRFEAT